MTWHRGYTTVFMLNDFDDLDLKMSLILAILI